MKVVTVRKVPISFKIVILLLGLIMVNGCASAPKPKSYQPVNKQLILNVPFDTVWQAVANSVTNSGEIIDTLQKEDGLVSFQRPLSVEELRKYAHTNAVLGYPLARANASIILKSVDGNSTQIMIKIQFFAGNNNLVLYSRGVLEDEYLKQIKDSF